MRRRLFIVGVKNSLNVNLSDFFNLDEYKSNITLSEFFNKQFEKENAYTIRCGGRHSKIDDRHNWNKYMVNNEVYTLSFDDCLKLQGFNDFKLSGNLTEKWTLLGNTIPTNLTTIIGKQICKYIIKCV
jgi:DNA (cytosine-5)-methyltransferase 1